MRWDQISLEELAGHLSTEFNKRQIDTVLVGGACVTIYSKNRYQSSDLDFVVYEDMKRVNEVLEELGFTEKDGYFCHKQCKWFVEFVSSPVAVGNEILSNFANVKVSTGTIKMLRVEDSVKDRLASYYHWGDIQSLNQAIDICLECTVDYQEIEIWSIREGCEDKYIKFQQRLRQVKSRSRRA